MSMHRHVTSATYRRSALLTVLLLAWPLFATAQHAPGASSSRAATMEMGSMSGMDHGSMDHSMPGVATPASPATAAKPVATKPGKKKPAMASAALAKSMSGRSDMDHGEMSGMDHQAMPGMDHSPPPASSNDPQRVGHGAMSGMDHGAMPGTTPAAKPTVQSGESGNMQGMDHRAMPGSSPAAMGGTDHGAMPGMSHGAAQGNDSMAGMPMGPMQGGSAPTNARSSDYSDGLNHGSMEHMGMHGSAPFGMLLIDQFEAFNGKRGSGQTWEAQGWYGNDVNKLWIRSEGDRSRGKIEDGDVEVFWNRNVATFWSTQLGVRHELGDGPTRHWAAFGIQGLAPYWFELEATAYVGPSGRTATRLRAQYELLFTQRLILQPEFEINLYGKSDPARRIGSGVSDAQLGLRLRYEIRRQFAPYVGVVWTRRFGATADFARDDHQAIFDRQWVAGVRIWL
jgi:copper resistance protein B